MGERNDAVNALRIKPTETTYRGVKVFHDPMEAHAMRRFRAHFDNGKETYSSTVAGILAMVDVELSKGRKLEPFVALKFGGFHPEEWRVNSITKELDGVNISQYRLGTQSREIVSKKILQRNAHLVTDPKGLFFNTEGNRLALEAIGALKKELNRIEMRIREKSRELTRVTWEDIENARKEKSNHDD